MIILFTKTNFNLKTFSANTKIIKDAALTAGFQFCGIAQAVKLDDDARRLETWLAKGMHGAMQYMENHFDLRIDPQKLVPGAKTVITLMLNYYAENYKNESQLKVSKYAFGKDYHLVIKHKLHFLLNILTEKIGAVNGHGFVDSAPVLERSWAQRSGLGWIGKNGNLINKQNGSFFFLATLITDVEAEYDEPFAADFCGTCTKCLDACPTNAILPDKVVDGSKCISYYTIELKNKELMLANKPNLSNWMFGCDICQDVCPWNRFSKQHNEPEFTPISEVLNLSTKEWRDMSEETFRRIFKDSPLKRAKLRGIQQNINLINKNSL